jgi:hypothetical protein
MAVSPSGDALSPKEPPAKTAPIIKGKLIFVVTASGIAIGIIKAQVPQADRIKHEVTHPKRKITASIINLGNCVPTTFV